ncbi:hypothetical protein LX36DRAFT_441515 [Colletotrichum falcatum]|nr:hypothetical protein LX36DRAFT_441515 [Colletotrichum falcatum]
MGSSPARVQSSASSFFGGGGETWDLGPCLVRSPVLFSRSLLCLTLTYFALPCRFAPSVPLPRHTHTYTTTYLHISPVIHAFSTVTGYLPVSFLLIFCSPPSLHPSPFKSSPSRLSPSPR